MTRPRAALAVAVAALVKRTCECVRPQTAFALDWHGRVTRIPPSPRRCAGCPDAPRIACLPCADVAPGVCDGDGGGR